jgi:hypothetical protein
MAYFDETDTLLVRLFHTLTIVERYQMENETVMLISRFNKHIVLMSLSELILQTPCSPFKINRGFGETCRLHLQGRRTSQVCRLIFNGLHSVMSQKTELFITTATKTSNPTFIKSCQDPQMIDKKFIKVLRKLL